jgi:hypothetical protein
MQPLTLPELKGDIVKTAPDQFLAFYLRYSSAILIKNSNLRSPYALSFRLICIRLHLAYCW